MNFMDLALSRRSIRSFKPDTVSDEDLLKLLNSAIYAPSAGNCQPWHFYVIKDQNIKQKIQSAAGNQTFISSAPVVIVVCADVDKNTSKYGCRGENLYCLQDTAAAIQNILICATDLGLGTCWCGDFDETALAEVLSLKPNLRPVSIIPVGYPNTSPSSPKRLPLKEVVTFIGECNIELSDSNIDETKKFEHLNLGGALFNDVNLGESTFTNINFYKTDITDANLAETEIHNCNLSNMNIYDCCLDGFKINGTHISDILK